MPHDPVVAPLVLIVCTGNICRSPMAQELLRAKLAAEGFGYVRVESAGTLGVPGPASAHAQEMIRRRGLDLSAHQGRRATRGVLADAGVILAMTLEHKRWLERAAPDYRAKIHMFSELGGTAYDVADPYGGSLAEYERTAAELEALVEEGWPQVIAWLGLAPSNA